MATDEGGILMGKSLYAARICRRDLFIVLMAAAALLAGARPASAGETTTYSYDALGRLTNAAHSGSVNGGLNQAYSHDAADNRTNVTVTGSPFSTSARVIVLPLKGMPVIPLTNGF